MKKQPKIFISERPRIEHFLMMNGEFATVFAILSALQDKCKNKKISNAINAHVLVSLFANENKSKAEIAELNGVKYIEILNTTKKALKEIEPILNKILFKFDTEIVAQKNDNYSVANALFYKARSASLFNRDDSLCYLNSFENVFGKIKDANDFAYVLAIELIVKAMINIKFDRFSANPNQSFDDFIRRMKILNAMDNLLFVVMNVWAVV